MEAFVYGTLTDPDRASSVLETYEFVDPATLVGLHSVEGRYPTLAPGGRVSGRILATPDVELLDRYEGVDEGLYVRISIPVREGGYVETYVGNPARLDAPVEWPGSGQFADRVRTYVQSNDVTVRRSAIET